MKLKYCVSIHLHYHLYMLGLVLKVVWSDNQLMICSFSEIMNHGIIMLATPRPPPCCCGLCTTPSFPSGGAPTCHWLPALLEWNCQIGFPSPCSLSGTCKNMPESALRSITTPREIRSDVAAKLDASTESCVEASAESRGEEIRCANAFTFFPGYHSLSLASEEASAEAFGAEIRCANVSTCFPGYHSLSLPPILTATSSSVFI